MPRFRKKPVEVEAIKFTGANLGDVTTFLGKEPPRRSLAVHGEAPLWAVMIETWEGPMRASPGEWIIKGVQGEFYPCKPDIFAETYEAVD